MGIRSNRTLEAARVYYLVLLVSLLWFMVQFLRFVFPPLFETFQAVYDISNTETGLLFTSIMLSYSAVQFPSGILGDRLGLPAVIIGGAAVFTGAALLAALSPTFLVLTLAAMSIGLGTGPHKTVAIPLLSRRYTEHPGRVLGVMDTVGQLGGMTAPLVVIALTSVFVWQSVFVLGAAVSATLALLFYRAVRRDPSLDVDRPSPKRRDSKADGDGPSYRAVFADRRLLAFVLVTVLFTFTWNGVSSFLPLFLATEKGIPTGTAGVLYSLLFAMTFSQTITGELGDRAGKLTVSVALFATMSVGIVALLTANSIVALIGATVVLGLGFHGFRPVRDAYLMEIIPKGVGGGTLGAVRTFMTGIGALAPATIGVLSDAVGFVSAFVFLGCTTAVAGAVTLVLR
ncbi:MAG: MFS transporter [Halobacteriota archaeon]|uniref:MFS transporter n=1 Tax=Natronomonas sp. TaxID=2184060 RepID=UPI0039750AB2